MLKQQTTLQYTIGLLLTLPFFGTHGAAIDLDLLKRKNYEAMQETFDGTIYRIARAEWLDIKYIASLLRLINGSALPQSQAELFFKEALKIALQDSLKPGDNGTESFGDFIKNAMLKKRTYLGDLVSEANETALEKWQQAFKAYFLEIIRSNGYQFSQESQSLDKDLDTLIECLLFGHYNAVVNAQAYNELLQSAFPSPSTTTNKAKLAAIGAGIVVGCYAVYKTKLPSKLFKHFFAKKAVALARR